MIARPTLSDDEAEAFEASAGEVVGTIAIDLMNIVVRHYPDLDPADREAARQRQTE